MLLFWLPFLNPPSAERTPFFSLQIFSTLRTDSLKLFVFLCPSDHHSLDRFQAPSSCVGSCTRSRWNPKVLLRRAFPSGGYISYCLTRKLLVTSSLKKQAIFQSIHAPFAWFEYPNVPTKTIKLFTWAKKSITALLNLKIRRCPKTLLTTAFLGAVRRVQHPGTILLAPTRNGSNGLDLPMIDQCLGGDGPDAMVSCHLDYRPLHLYLKV